jgi:hypothetical protein
MHRCTKKLSPTFTISTRVTLEHLMISRLHLYGSISRPTPAPPIEPGQAAPSGDASRRTPQSPFGGQACALTKTVHPAQLAGQVTGGTGSRLPPTLRSAPSGDTLRVRCATRGVLRDAKTRTEQGVSRIRQQKSISCLAMIVKLNTPLGGSASWHGSGVKQSCAERR